MHACIIATRALKPCWLYQPVSKRAVSIDGVTVTY
eukprot:COSAG04_NODE_32022_length_253_cov_1.006494_1_plen_34_part_01